jgi:hypothetical protein
MSTPEIAAQLDRELAAADLEHAARQFRAVVAQVAAGDSSQAQLRIARHRLQAAALRFAAADGWQPTNGGTA